MPHGERVPLGVGDVLAVQGHEDLLIVEDDLGSVSTKRPRLSRCLILWRHCQAASRELACLEIVPYPGKEGSALTDPEHGLANASPPVRGEGRRGFSGCLRRRGLSNALVLASVSSFPKPLATRSRVSRSVTVGGLSPRKCVSDRTGYPWSP